MSGNFDDSDEPRRLLSALADGDADAADCARASAAWAAGDDTARSRWHSYHLIGDVLRSDELAVAPGRDEAFLQRLRLRLASEPAVLAPAPLRTPVVPVQPAGQRAGQPSRRWLPATAVAAGVMGLGTLLALSQWGQSSSSALSGSQLATLPPPTTSLVMEVSLPSATFDAVAVGGKVVRDPQLDRYLRAHREYGATAPGSLPGGASRGIETVSLQR